MSNPTNNCNITFYPYDSHYVVKEITIPSCNMFIKQEVTIECFDVCHRCNRCKSCRRCPISYYYLTSKDNKKTHCKRQNPTCKKCTMNESENICKITFDSCAPYVEKGIQGQIDDGRLLQLIVNLTHFCPNRTVLVGVILTSDEKPFAIKTKTLHITHHRNADKTTLTSTCFEFLLPEEVLCTRIKAKFMIEFVC